MLYDFFLIGALTKMTIHWECHLPLHPLPLLGRIKQRIVSKTVVISETTAVDKTI
jgi:hypothetical protein